MQQRRKGRHILLEDSGAAEAGDETQQLDFLRPPGAIRDEHAHGADPGPRITGFRSPVLFDEHRLGRDTGHDTANARELGRRPRQRHLRRASLADLLGIVLLTGLGLVIESRDIEVQDRAIKDRDDMVRGAGMTRGRDEQEDGRQQHADRPEDAGGSEGHRHHPGHAAVGPYFVAIAHRYRSSAATRHPVTPLVLLVLVMPSDPVAVQAMRLTQLIEHPPELLVLHGAIALSTPSCLLPLVEPGVEPVDHVLAVRVDRHLARRRERLQPLDHRDELHPVVRRVGLATRAFTLGARAEIAQDEGPAPRTGVARARPVREELHPRTIV